MWVHHNLSGFQMAESRKKLDIPFGSDTEIAEMVEQFEQCQWPYERWTHRAHLGVAATYLQRFPFEIALECVRHHIQQYNQKCGDPNGYHETVTILFMRKVSGYLKEQIPEASLTVAVDILAKECNMNWLLKYYTAEQLWSSEAKRSWLEPDLQVLDF
jgi:hypothetical protein